MRNSIPLVQLLPLVHRDAAESTKKSAYSHLTTMDPYSLVKSVEEGALQHSTRQVSRCSLQNKVIRPPLPLRIGSLAWIRLEG
jgi:hypothetical protein